MFNNIERINRNSKLTPTQMWNVFPFQSLQSFFLFRVSRRLHFLSLSLSLLHLFLCCSMDIFLVPLNWVGNRSNSNTKIVCESKPLRKAINHDGNQWNPVITFAKFDYESTMHLSHYLKHTRVKLIIEQPCNH